jgi:hypothetical protein
MLGLKKLLPVQKKETKQRRGEIKKLPHWVFATLRLIFLGFPRQNGQKKREFSAASIFHLSGSAFACFI